jgi:hypothetical protein
MNKSLGLIAGFGFGLALISFVLAAALSPGSFRAMGYFRPAGESPGQSAPGSSQWAWDGGDRLQIDIPARVRLTSGSGAPVVIVRGDQDVLKQIAYSHGQITGYNIYDCFLGLLCDDGRRERPIDVEVRGVTLNRIDVSGVAQVNLGELNQDKLTLRISGAGQVEGEGHVNNLDLSISGAGKVELARLAATNAKVSLSGAGMAEIAPSDEADIDISGVGNVNLATKPKNLKTDISGMGHVNGPGVDRHRGHMRDHDTADDFNRQIRDKIKDRVKEQIKDIKADAKERAKEQIKSQNIGARIGQEVGAEIDKAFKQQGL